MKSSFPTKLLIFTNLALIGLVAYLVATKGLNTSSVAYSDWVAVLLTAVTIVVGGIGIIIAMAAIWGYQKISDHAKESAINASLGELASIWDKPDFKTRLKSVVEEHIENHIKMRATDSVDPTPEASHTDNRADAAGGDTEWVDNE